MRLRSHDSSENFDSELGRGLRDELASVVGPTPDPAKAAYRAGSSRSGVLWVATRVTTRLAAGAAIGVLVLGGAVAAAASRGQDPITWGRGVVEVVIQGCSTSTDPSGSAARCGQPTPGPSASPSEKGQGQPTGDAGGQSPAPGSGTIPAAGGGNKQGGSGQDRQWPVKPGQSQAAPAHGQGQDPVGVSSGGRQATPTPSPTATTSAGVNQGSGGTETRGVSSGQGNDPSSNRSASGSGGNHGPEGATGVGGSPGPATQGGAGTGTGGQAWWGGVAPS